LKCNNPSCENGLVKPDIVFFGESLPKEFFNKLEDDFEKCDLLIVMGTSLKVQPFASLTGLVSKDCPRLLINRDPVGNNFLYERADLNYRDVFLQGDCDEGCLKMCKLLKWDNDLKVLNSPQEEASQK
jgi:NAD-dependent SIR2 family protein deacetylase